MTGFEAVPPPRLDELEVETAWVRLRRAFLRPLAWFGLLVLRYLGSEAW